MRKRTRRPYWTKSERAGFKEAGRWGKALENLDYRDAWFGAIIAFVRGSRAAKDKP